MKTNASSTASAWGIKRYICPCEVGTKITYGGSNLQLSMYKLHKRGQRLFFWFYSNEIHTCAYSKFCILYHITYTTIEALLYQHLRFILTFKSNISMISFRRKHCKYDLHDTFMHPFYALHLSLTLMAKTTEEQSVCKNNWLFVCLYKSLPSTCFVHLYNFLFMCNAFVFCLKNQDIFLEKAVLILILYHLFIPMFINI